MLGYQTEADAPVVPLKLVMEICETPENVCRNIQATLGREYVRFNEYLDSQSGTVSICGFGPSFAETYKNLEGDVIACNGAHDYLISHGIVPKFAMFYDAAECIADFIVPHSGVIYLIGSRCHESVFKKLEGFRVVVWHVKGDQCVDELLAKADLMEPMIHGGSAAVTRAMFVAHALGYRELHLHGADSSYTGEFTHVKKSIVHEDSLDIFAIGKWFKSTPWMAGQVEDLKLLGPQLQSIGAKLIVHGTGLFQHVAKAMGIEVRE